MTLKFYTCTCATPHLHKISNLTKKIVSTGQFTFDYKVLKRYMNRKIVKQGIIWFSNMQIRYLKDLCEPCLNTAEVSPGFAKPCPLALRNQRSHFFLRCKTCKANFGSLWQNLNSKILLMTPTDGIFICSFLNNLDQNNKILFLLGGLPLPFEVVTSIMIRRFVSSAVGKICKMRTNKHREQEAP